ncbi:hypothetical protein EGW08_010298 [Elysia chlorotica]|uniref:Peptidase S1 domain-containing protein n=1 Tax=Elysia chlorotica TaxID=188477 RepID=A0A3S0ZNH3_ELYCH|nr:hypothetical protein EGW08_010298 [Elysia chlorotica]
MAGRLRRALRAVADKIGKEEPVVSYTVRFEKDFGIFGLLHLPANCRDQRVVHYLRLFSRMTVKLTTTHTSEEREGAYKLMSLGDGVGMAPRRLATGFAWLPGKTSELKCPIQDCHHGPQPHSVYGYIRIITNKHVVYNEDEALATQGEFWDEEVLGKAYSASSRRISVQCVSLEFCQEDNDAAHLWCVTHDPWLCSDLELEMSELRHRYSQIPLDIWERAKSLCVTVSHPHGMRKMITIGRHMRVVETSSRSHAHYHSCATCPGSSGAPVLYTSPEIQGALPMWLPAVHSYYCPSEDINCAFK